jgi:hypothetical protein
LNSLPLLVVLLASRAAADPYAAKTYPKGAVRTLTVESDEGPITLRQTLDGPTSVDLSPAAKPGDDCQIIDKLDGSTLHLIVRAARNPLGQSNTCAAGWTVTTSVEVLDARSGSGDIAFDSRARKIDARTGSGAISVGSVAPNAELFLRSGSGTISGDAAAAKIDAVTGSGDIHLTSLTGLVKAKSGSGAIALDWIATPASGAIEANTGSGSLNASFPKKTKLNTTLRTAAGSVKDDFGDKDAKLSLTFKSGSGDATVSRKP